MNKRILRIFLKCFDPFVREKFASHDLLDSEHFSEKENIEKFTNVLTHFVWEKLNLTRTNDTNRTRLTDFFQNFQQRKIML